MAEYMHAGNTKLTVGMVRAARDRFGEDCEMSGHPAQRVAWEMIALWIDETSWKEEQKERMKEFWLGQKFNVEADADADTISFSRNGVVVGAIKRLAIPMGYAY